MSSFLPIVDAASFSPSLVPAASPPARTIRTPAEQPEQAVAESEPLPVDVETLLIEAEARGRAAAQAEIAAERQALAAREQQVVELAEAVERARLEDAEISRQLIGALITTGLGRLIGNHPVLQAAALQESFQQVATGLVGEREVVLRVAPDQADLARELVAHRPGWTVREDTEIHSGLRVETARGSLDSTLEAAMKAMSSAVSTWLEEER